MSSQRLRWLVLAVCVVGTAAVSSCGDKSAEQSTARKSEAAGPEIAKPSETTADKEKAPGDTAAPSKKANRTLAAKAEIAEMPDGGTETFSFSVGIAEDGSADGRMTVKGDALRLTGTVRDGAVRLWATGPEEGALRGGFFIGTETGGEAAGSFVLSGNGGAPAIQGTWKTH